MAKVKLGKGLTVRVMAYGDMVPVKFTLEGRVDDKDIPPHPWLINVFNRATDDDRMARRNWVIPILHEHLQKQQIELSELIADFAI